MKWSARFLILILIATIFPSSFPQHVGAASGISILTYHYIRDYTDKKDPVGIQLSVSPSNFDQQMAYLSTHGYTPITLDTLYGVFNHQSSVAGKPVVLTFDDGYSDFYTSAYPILQKYKIHAVAFIVTGFVGKPGYLSWDAIHQMQSSGLVSFEAHTVHHYYLTRLPYSSILAELQESKATLQSQIGTVVNFVAYPYGAVNGSVTRAAQAAGFVGGVSTRGGKDAGQGFTMSRYGVSGRYSLSSFASLL